MDYSKLSSKIIDYRIRGVLAMGKNTSRELEKIKKLEEQIAKKKAALQLTQARIKERERKTRTRRLIEIGGLADIAGISDIDKGALLGAFIHVSEKLKDNLAFSKFKAEGDATLKERAKEKRAN